MEDVDTCLCEVMISYELLQAGEVGRFPVEYYARYHHYLRRLEEPDGQSDHLPAED